MRAALVTSFSAPPRLTEVDEPELPSGDRVVLDVLAVGLHPRVRSGASGAHYTSTGALPLIPGIDGVGRLQDGRVVYFVADDELPGPMAERTTVDLRRTVVLPGGTDPLLVAALMNPAMSSWVALRRRIAFRPGQSVLVLGAAGNAGAIAVHVAKHLGASRVVGAARTPRPVVGADEVVALADVGRAAAEVDIVLDYLWGEPARAAMLAVVRARSDRGRLLDWVQIGSVAGPDLALPSVVLRSSALRIQGNGQGAVSTRGYLEELPALVAEIAAGTFALAVSPRPLADVEAVWQEADLPGVRTVVVP